MNFKLFTTKKFLVFVTTRKRYKNKFLLHIQTLLTILRIQENCLHANEKKNRPFGLEGKKTKI
jgi:hypothetical protein